MAEPFGARLRALRRHVPAEVRTLGWISFWNDAASELIYPLVPLLVTQVLGAPVAAVGLIEGAGAAVATFLRGPSGAASDRRGRRPFVWFGYGISSLSKPLLALAGGWPAVLALRLADRVGKGVRTAPRDALIRDVTPPDRWGAAFGYHRSLDTAGAVVGPLVAIALLALGLGLRQTIAVAAVPAVVSLVLVARIREPLRQAVSAAPGARAALDRGLRWIALGWVVFSLGNSADAFLILRGSTLGLSDVLVVLAYALYNAVWMLGGWPAGVLSDRIGRRAPMVVGLLVFALAYAGFALAGQAWQLWPLFALYGVHMALTDGIVKAMISDGARADRVGAAMGWITAAGGLAALVASLAAGVLWDRVGPGAVFALGAVGALAGALVFALAPLPHQERARA